MTEGTYSHEGATLKLALVTWEGERRVDHVLEVAVPPATILERMEVATTPAKDWMKNPKREHVIVSISFSLNGTMYAAPCNALDHFVLDSDEL